VISQAGARGEDLSEVLATRILDVPDYPQPGVVFKDITPLLGDPAGFAAVVEAIAGEGAVVRFGRRVPPYGETRNYVKRISYRYRRNAVKPKGQVAGNGPAPAGER